MALAELSFNSEKNHGFNSWNRNFAVPQRTEVNEFSWQLRFFKLSEVVAGFLLMNRVCFIPFWLCVCIRRAGCAKGLEHITIS